MSTDWPTAPVSSANRTSTSSATPTSPSPPRSTGSSPTRSNPAGSSRACGSRRCASSARPCASTRTRSAPSIGAWPTTATSRSRHGAGTVVADRTVHRRRPEALGGDRVRDAPARRAGRASRPTRSRPRPTPPPRSASARVAQVRVLFAECTTADAGYDAERLNREFAGLDRGRGHAARRAPRAARAVPLRPRRDDDVPCRRGAGPGRRPRAGRGDARRAGLRRARPRDRRRCREGSRVGVVCASDRGTDNIAETLSIAGTKGVEIVSATIDDDERLDADRPHRRPDPHVARSPRRRASTSGCTGPSGSGRGPTSSTPPGLELLRRAIEHVAAERRREPAADARSPEPARGLTSFARCGRSPWRGRRDGGTGSSPSSGARARSMRPTRRRPARSRPGYGGARRRPASRPSAPARSRRSPRWMRCSTA